MLRGDMNGLGDGDAGKLERASLAVLLAVVSLRVAPLMGRCTPNHPDVPAVRT